MKSENDFRSFLETIYSQRTANNPRYSVRAFAKALVVDQSLLTKVINGKRIASKALMDHVLRKLEVDSKLVAQLKEGKRSLKKSQTDEDYRRIQGLDFEIISDWYNFAILELLLIKNFVAKPYIISKCLKISVNDAKGALNRLSERGLIEQDGKSFKVTSKNNTWADTKQTSIARKNLQKKLLEKAKDSIDTVPFDLRENGSLTLAFNASKMEKVKKLIQRFKNQILDYSEKEGRYSEVYQLVVGFYPLSYLEETKLRGKP